MKLHNSISINDEITEPMTDKHLRTPFLGPLDPMPRAHHAFVCRQSIGARQVMLRDAVQQHDQRSSLSRAWPGLAWPGLAA